MHAAQARLKRRRVIGDDEIARPEQRRQFAARHMSHPAVRTDGQLDRWPVEFLGNHHDPAPTRRAEWLGSRRARRL
jgi:hypothetical protein